MPKIAEMMKCIACSFYYYANEDLILNIKLLINVLRDIINDANLINLDS